MKGGDLASGAFERTSACVEGKSMGRERWGSLVWLGIGIVISVASYRLSVGTFRNPGPGFLPFITGAILTLLSLILFVQTRKPESGTDAGKPFFTNKGRAWKATLALIALLAYSLGMEYLGFLVSTTIFLAFLLGVVEPQKWYIVAFGSGLVVVASYTIFEILLKSPLPKGIFE
jgi:putative tricarboxylic transport membrane protein